MPALHRSDGYAREAMLTMSARFAPHANRDRGWHDRAESRHGRAVASQPQGARAALCGLPDVHRHGALSFRVMHGVPTRWQRADDSVRHELMLLYSYWRAVTYYV